MKFKVGFFSAIAAGALVLCASAPAKAIMMSVTSSANNTTTSLTGGSSGDRAQANALSVTDPSGNSGVDTIGAALVDIAARYTSNAAADRGVAVSGGAAKATINSDYTVTFSVTPVFSGTTYNVVVDTKILGELTLLDDIATTAGTVTVSNVTGFLNAVNTAGLGIGGISQSFSTGTGVNDAQERNISGSNSINLGTFSGPQSFTVRFTFTTSASSPQNLGGGDEAAARFGSSGPLGGATADDYPGPGDVVDRVQANDGHFVTATATILTIPEPSTLLMAGIGAVGLALAGWRRRVR